MPVVMGPGVRACEEYLPHPEELAKQASRRMDTTDGLAAILRDARKGALLRMRSEIYFTGSFAGDDSYGWCIALQNLSSFRLPSKYIIGPEGMLHARISPDPDFRHPP